MKRIHFLFLLWLLPLLAGAQAPVQTLRGTVTDVASHAPLGYARISLSGTQLGVLTDSAGNFVLPGVPVGRYDVRIDLEGYETAELREIQVNSAREVVLNIHLQEKTVTLETVEIRPHVNKEEPLSGTATVSARMLSVEEARRYAGGFDDPARLVSAFAGVASNVGNNAIVVRGNNPQSLQWKLEGVEISNPNHFADLNAFGGGGLTALSAQMLDNSDFFSGAMPADYNNALSGVFDISMRTGNAAQREHTVQIGAIGIDLASEGPFRKGGRAAYLFNYRYSTLGLLAPLLPENAAGTRYQDLAFKLNFPTAHAGTFALWGMGLRDHSDADARLRVEDWRYEGDRQNQDADQSMGAAGLSHTLLLDSKRYLKTTVALTGNGLELHSDRLDSSLSLHPHSHIRNLAYQLVISSRLHTKFSARHTHQTGIVFTRMQYDMLLQQARVTAAPLQEIVNAAGGTGMLSAYTHSGLSLTPRLTANLGLNVQAFLLNGTLSPEPRAGLRYRLSPRQTLNLAYGLHSRLERLNYYFIQDDAGAYLNRTLGFSRAHHLVAGYDLKTSEFTHLRIEPYVQHLFGIPVMADSSFSLLNQQNAWFFDGKLENTGQGRNYGVDMTFEKYLSRGYYGLLTASLFESRYRGGDLVWRSTRYNRNYALNFLIGKEWQLGKHDQNVLSLNLRLSYQGGDRYSPVNETLTAATQTVVLDETRAFSRQYGPAFTSHFTAGYKMNRQKTTQEIALKIINLTQFREYFGYQYNYQTGRAEQYRELTFIPNISYRIEF